MSIGGVVAPRSHRLSLQKHPLLGSRRCLGAWGGEAPLGTHPRADRARRGCPCCRWRSGCGGRERRAVRGEPGYGPALQSARARPGPGFAAPPPGKGASRRAPPRAASGRVAWTRLPWQPELEAFPARPRPARRRPSSRRVPTPKIAFPRRRGSPPSPQQGVGGRALAYKNLGGRGRCRERCLCESPAFLPGGNVIHHLPGIPSILYVPSLFPTEIVICALHLKLGRS